ncbi:hypothetical protein BD560DRAFT_429595 [Blakeslea trispora]|nr:hypothetical protein BD560DRAFT_429595 [Blakeslea trispora]
MSVDLLNQFDSLNHSEKIVLKLALSHTISFFDDEHIALYKKYIKSEQLWSLWEEKQKEMEVEEEMKKIVEDVFGAVVKEAKKGLDNALKFVLKEQLSLLDKGQRKSLKYQMLEAASYLLHNVENWENDVEPSEAEVVSRVSSLLSIFFNDSDIKIKIGETTAECTKANRSYNESQFSGGCRGTLSAVEEGAGNVFVAYPLGNVEVPTDRMLFDGVFVESMVRLCQWKTYLVGLGRQVKANTIRFGPIQKNRDGFSAIFTPKLRSVKRKRSST